MDTEGTNFCFFNPNFKSAALSTLTIAMVETLKQSDEIKYLGIKLDSKLTWKNHIQKVKFETIKFASTGCPKIFYQFDLLF